MPKIWLDYRRTRHIKLSKLANIAVILEVLIVVPIVILDHVYPAWLPTSEPYLAPSALVFFLATFAVWWFHYLLKVSAWQAGRYFWRFWIGYLLILVPLVIDLAYPSSPNSVLSRIEDVSSYFGLSLFSYSVWRMQRWRAKHIDVESEEP